MNRISKFSNPLSFPIPAERRKREGNFLSFPLRKVKGKNWTRARHPRAESRKAGAHFAGDNRSTGACSLFVVRGRAHVSSSPSPGTDLDRGTDSACQPPPFIRGYCHAVPLQRYPANIRGRIKRGGINHDRVHSGGFNRRFRAKFSGEERVDEFLFFLETEETNDWNCSAWSKVSGGSNRLARYGSLLREFSWVKRAVADWVENGGVTRLVGRIYKLRVGSFLGSVMMLVWLVGVIHGMMELSPLFEEGEFIIFYSWRVCFKSFQILSFLSERKGEQNSRGLN